MLFSSFTFIFAFLPIVWVIFHLLKRARFKSHYKVAKIFLILSSLFFYAFWKVAYLPILLSSIIVNYTLAKLILKNSTQMLIAESKDSLLSKANATTLGGGGNQHLDSNATSSLRVRQHEAIQNNTISVMTSGNSSLRGSVSEANTTKQSTNRNVDCHESLRDSRNDEAERNESTYNSHNDGNRQFKSFRNDSIRFTPKIYFILGIIFNLCLLGFFKYTDFLLENFNAFSKLAHLDFNIPLPHILLPLALSFVTFQQIAFLFDCYKRVKGELNENLRIDFIDYALFISFFPQLIAGPIVHHREMMPQFAKMGNSSLGMQFRTCENFWDSTDSKSSFYPKNSHKYKSHTAKYFDCDSHCESATNQARICNFSSLRGESMDSPKQSTINYEFLAKGIFIFSIGLFKKAFIADSFAKWANVGFSVVGSGGMLNIAESWATSLSYTFQLYFDFSGYCDMAMGLALMFGIVLPLNFDSPYKSLNISEFWRRWHITLGRFLRECLYIPLGGNRVSKILNLRNLFIVAFLSGIWHGAGWGFVIWGVLHGVAMMIHRIYSWWSANSSKNAKYLSNSCGSIFRRFCGFSSARRGNRTNASIDEAEREESRKSVKKTNALYKFLCWFITFNFVNLAWIFFRAENLNGAVNLIKGMFGFANLEIPQKWSKIFSALQDGTNEIIIWIVCAVVVCVACKNSFEMLKGFDKYIAIKSLFAVILVLISFCVMLFATRKIEFLYFNF